MIEALDYMSVEEFIDLCIRIKECYNKKKSREETKEEN